MFKFVVFFIALTLLLVPVHTTHAATFDVCDLAELTSAITTANSNAQADTINFNCSTTLTFPSEFTILNDGAGNGITINSNGNTVIFDGGDSTRFFTVNTGASLTLNSLTLQNGFIGGSGGAIFNLTIGTVIINNSTFISNSAIGGGAITNLGIMTINNSTFRDNTSSIRGGAITNGANLTLNNATFINNRSDSGGAIYNDTGTMTINGGRYEIGLDTTNTISQGGILWVSNTSIVTINDALFLGGLMSPQFGGGIFNTGDVTVNRSTFYGLTATGDGGAIYNQSGNITISNSTFSNNSANFGGGVFNNGTATITHSTFVANTDIGSGGALNSSVGNYTLAHNLIEGVAPQCGSGVVADATNLSDTPCDVATVVADVGLGAYDGFAYPLIAISPARDFYSAPCDVSGDVYGTSRPQGTGCDVGAYELPVVNLPLDATAVCIGNDLQVIIHTGDAPFQITSSAGTLATGLTLGTHIIPAFGSQTGVNVTELLGDTENFPLGDIDCSPNTLSASAVCVGNDLHVTIGNGEAPFQITSSAGTLATGLTLGTHIIPAFGSQTGVNVTELAGDTENFPLGDIDCTAVIAPPPPPPTSSALVLGCVFDAPSGVSIINAPDNTYCRLLMKNGGVTDFSGAIPAEFISLGVILAVDVYRLEGGRSLTEFPNYARVCLAGQGRLFYMDSRNAPRVSIELATETEGNLTCGWIPAPGTLILTN